jgi:hypothetical protein
MRRHSAVRGRGQGLGHGSVNCFGAAHTRLALLAGGPDWGDLPKADDASPSLGKIK